MHKTVRPTCANLTSVSHSPINTNALPKRDHDCFIYFNFQFQKLKKLTKHFKIVFNKSNNLKNSAFIFFYI